jgi:hypothetical protein
MSESIFTAISIISKLEKEIEDLKQKNALLEQKEAETKNFNIEAECLCLYTNSLGAHIYGNIGQLEKIIKNCKNIRYETTGVHPNWGPGYRFNSIADARTCLLKNGYKFAYSSTTHWCPVIQAISVENWFKGI